MLTRRLLTLCVFSLTCLTSNFSQDKFPSGNSVALVGTWKLAIVVPTGIDTTGTLTLRRTDAGFSAVLQDEGTTVSLRDVVVSDNSFSARFAETDRSGKPMSGLVTASLDGDSLNGRISYEMPRKAKFRFTGRRSSEDARTEQSNAKPSSLDKSQFETVARNRVKLFPDRYENKLISVTGWIGEIRKHDSTFFLTFKSESGEYFFALPATDGFSFVVTEGMADELLRRYDTEDVTSTRLIAANLYGKLVSYQNAPNLPPQFRKKEYAFIVARIEALSLNGKPIWSLEVADKSTFANPK